MNGSIKTTVFVGLASCIAIVLAACINRKDLTPSPFSPITPILPAPAVKNALYVFEEDNCPWCEKEKTALKAADLSSFAVSEINSWAKATLWSVHAYPTLVVVDPSGKELSRHEGYLDPHALEAWLHNYKSAR